MYNKDCNLLHQLRILKRFSVKENCLKQLKQKKIEQEKQLKKISFSRDNNITENTNLKDFQEVELNQSNQFKYFLFFTTFGLKHVNKAITHLSSYQNIVSLKLNLNWNRIKVSKIKKYGLGQQKLQNLKYLNINLQGNTTLHKGTIAVANCLQWLKNLLQFLQLSLNFGNNYCGRGPQIIGKAIENLKHLTYINIIFDQCISSSIQSFGLSLEKLQNLTFLTLNFTNYNINKDTLECLGSSIKKIIKLTHLNLDIHGINEYDLNGAVSLARSLRTLQNVVSLKLNFNNNFIKHSSWWRKIFLKKKKLVMLTL
ncbi:hypothetical protein ABPG72_018009 [Tetrahymena utriculariae]